MTLTTKTTLIDTETQSQTDTDDTSSCETDSLSGDVTMIPVEEFFQEDGARPGHDEDVPRVGNVGINSGEEFLLVNADRHQHDNDDNITVKPVEEFLQVDHDQSTMAPIEEFLRADGRLHTSEISKGISKISELTLDQFQNNYKLFTQKLDGIKTGLVIRAILLKNSEVIFNYSFKIVGTDNIQNATITAANKVCNLYLVCALKGDTLLCSMGAGHNCAHVSITRNVHVANFIDTLNKIKDKTGLYIMVSALNCDWLEYAGGNTTYENLYVAPNKIKHYSNHGCIPK